MPVQRPRQAAAALQARLDEFERDNATLVEAYRLLGLRIEDQDRPSVLGTVPPTYQSDSTDPEDQPVTAAS